jgi:PAS domain S-box-containing protein
MQHDPEVTGYLFEHARDIILVIDAEDGSIIAANRAAEEAYRCTRDQLLALKIFDLRLEETPSVATQMRTAVRHGILFEALHRRCDGTTFSVEVSSRASSMSTGRRYLFSVIRDITERKRLERERQRLLEATEQALALRDEFLVIASHELRTPLTNVNLQLQQLDRLLDRPQVSYEQLRARTAAALREADRLGALISALIDAQVTKGQLGLEVGEVDLRELVQDIIERLRVRIEQVGSDVRVEVPSVTGRWDRLRLDQVITNLVVNALKYGAGGALHIRASASAETVTLEVIDHGIGISPEDSERIFGKFERAVPSHHGGLGLGLFIARQIVESHGGTIGLESTLGSGSVFKVTLPR